MEGLPASSQFSPLFSPAVAIADMAAQNVDPVSGDKFAKGCVSHD